MNAITAVLVGALGLQSAPLQPIGDGYPSMAPLPQGTLLRGVVRDTAGRGVEGAEVIIPVIGAQGITGPDGRFALSGVVGDSVLLVVRRIGFDPSSFWVPRTLFNRIEVVLRANPLVRQLPDIEVVGKTAKPARYARTTKYDDFFRRRRVGLGTFVSRDQIERMNAFQSLEILRGIPGVFVAVGPGGMAELADVRFARCNGPDAKVAVYVDGQRLLPASGPPTMRPRSLISYQVAEMMSRINASDVEMVEVYRGTAQIPGEFNEDACAVVALWTRWNPVPRDTAKP